jgi:hypothetical protein
VNLVQVNQQFMSETALGDPETRRLAAELRDRMFAADTTGAGWHG